MNSRAAVAQCETIICLQINDSDLIGASAGAMAALKRAASDTNSAVWLIPAVLVVDVYASVHSMLHSARGLPSMDPAIPDASWKRSWEVRLPQNMAAVRPNMACVDARTIIPRKSSVCPSAAGFKLPDAASAPWALSSSKICIKLAVHRCSRDNPLHVAMTSQIVSELWSERHIKGPEMWRSEAATTAPLIAVLLHSVVCSTVRCTQQRCRGVTMQSHPACTRVSMQTLPVGWWWDVPH